MNRRAAMVAAGFLLLFSAACRHPVIRPLSRETTVELEEGGCAVIAHWPWPGIRLAETYDRYFWPDPGSIRFSIEGLWDPRPELESQAVAALKKHFGVPAERARDRVKAARIAEFSALAERVFRRAPRGLDDRPVGEMYTLFAEANFDHLCELFILDLVVPNVGSPPLQMTVLCRFIRLKDDAVVGLVMGRSEVPLGVESLTDLARNDLALLKKVLKEVSSEQVRRGQFYGIFAGNLFPDSKD